MFIEGVKVQKSHKIIKSHNTVSSCFRNIDTLAVFHRILVKLLGASNSGINAPAVTYK